MWTITAYGVATNESNWMIEKGSHTYNLKSCTTYSYDDVSLFISYFLSLLTFFKYFQRIIN